MSDEVRIGRAGRAGRVGPHRESHEPRLLATRFLRTTASGEFHNWDGATAIGTDWGMDENNVYGDCGPAATDHNNAAKSGDPSVIGTLGEPTFTPGVLGAYFAYGIAQGEPGPDPDQGVDNATWLAFLYKNGIIDGYGEVPLTHLDHFAPYGHGLILGLAIDGAEAQADFESTPRRPWREQPQQDGHDVLLIETKSDGDITIVTWGGLQPCTKSFREHNITDAWIIFDKDDPQVDWAALQAALDEVHGVINPQGAAA